MATLHVENVPEDVLMRLSERAELQGRSLDHEVVETLRQSIEVSDRERRLAIRRLHEIRKGLENRGVWISGEEMDAAIDFGRE